jgi:hypothetical protein
LLFGSSDPADSELLEFIEGRPVNEIDKKLEETYGATVGRGVELPGAEALAPYLRLNQSLSGLDLSRAELNKAAFGKVVGAISEAPASNIKFVDFSRSPGVTDAGLASLAQCKQLQTVDASGCAGVTSGAGLVALMQEYKQPKLGFEEGRLRLSAETETLTIDRKLVDDGLVARWSELSGEIERFDISGCAGVTDAGLASLLQCKKRRSVVIRGSAGIRDRASIQAIQSSGIEVLMNSPDVDILVEIARRIPELKGRNGWGYLEQHRSIEKCDGVAGSATEMVFELNFSNWGLKPPAVMVIGDCLQNLRSVNSQSIIDATSCDICSLDILATSFVTDITLYPTIL